MKCVCEVIGQESHLGSDRLLRVHIEGHAGLGTALRTALVGAGAVEVVGQLEREVPDVAITVVGDGTTPLGEPAEPPHLVVASEGSEASLLAALRTGAAGYLAAPVERAQLLEALHRVAKRQSVVDPDTAMPVLRRMAHGLLPDDASRRWNLRPRELEVLHHLVAGSSTFEITRAMGIRETTVKTHLRSVLRKLGARDRAHAVALALRPDSAVYGSIGH